MKVNRIGLIAAAVLSTHAVAQTPIPPDPRVLSRIELAPQEPIAVSAYVRGAALPLPRAMAMATGPNFEGLQVEAVRYTGNDLALYRLNPEWDMETNMEFFRGKMAQRGRDEIEIIGFDLEGPGEKVKRLIDAEGLHAVIINPGEMRATPREVTAAHKKAKAEMEGGGSDVDGCKANPSICDGRWLLEELKRLDRRRKGEPE